VEGREAKASLVSETTSRDPKRGKKRGLGLKTGIRLDTSLSASNTLLRVVRTSRLLQSRAKVDLPLLRSSPHFPPFAPPAMVLLQLTSPLQARLDKLLPLLPFELRREVASHLVEDEEKRDGEGEALEGTEEALNEKKSGGKERTVSHEMLVEVSRWARGREDLADPGAFFPCFPDFQTMLTSSNTDDYRLASLLRLTDVHAPPLLPREQVRFPFSLLPLTTKANLHSSTVPRTTRHPLLHPTPSRPPRLHLPNLPRARPSPLPDPYDGHPRPSVPRRKSKDAC
jgi:hypothetical protein